MKSEALRAAAAPRDITERRSSTALREQICGVMREALNVEPPPPDTDLIASGLFDSLAIVILLVAIEERLGVSVPLDGLALDDVRTVAMLEQLLNKAQAEPFAPAHRVAHETNQSRQLCPLKVGVGLPLYLVHSSYGAAIGLQPIADALLGTRPVWGLQAVGLDSAGELQTTVEEMAETYVAAVRSHQPLGPYSVVGHSFGGLVAFEMARRLRGIGEEIELLALIDTQVHRGALTLTRAARMRNVLGALLNHGRMVSAHPVSQIPRYLALPRYLGLARERLGSSPTIASALAAMQLPPRMADVKLACDAAEAAFTPSRYDGDMVLFRAERRRPGKLDPALSWAQHLRGELQVVETPGGHGELSQAALVVIGAALDGELKRAAWARQRVVHGEVELLCADVDGAAIGA